MHTVSRALAGARVEGRTTTARLVPSGRHDGAALDALSRCLILEVHLTYNILTHGVDPLALSRPSASTHAPVASIGSPSLAVMVSSPTTSRADASPLEGRAATHHTPTPARRKFLHPHKLPRPHALTY